MVHVERKKQSKDESDQHWNCVPDNTEEIATGWTGAAVGLPKWRARTTIATRKNNQTQSGSNLLVDKNVRYRRAHLV